jgi:hypothetical protein
MNSEVRKVNRQWQMKSGVKFCILVESEKKMKPGFLYSIVIGLLALALALVSGCTSKAPTPPPVDVAGTVAVQLASSMLTQTVAAYSPTPPPVTPSLTPTMVPVTPTETVYVATNRPEVQTEPRASCWKGGPPELGYKLDSNISAFKKVEMLGTGSIPGWYVILNPYFHAPCWIKAEDLKMYSDIELSTYPLMTPGAPK